MTQNRSSSGCSHYATTEANFGCHLPTMQGIMLLAMREVGICSPMMVYLWWHYFCGG